MGVERKAQSPVFHLACDCAILVPSIRGQSSLGVSEIHRKGMRRRHPLFIPFNLASRRVVLSTLLHWVEWGIAVGLTYASVGYHALAVWPVGYQYLCPFVVHHCIAKVHVSLQVNLSVSQQTFPLPRPNGGVFEASFISLSLCVVCVARLFLTAFFRERPWDESTPRKPLLASQPLGQPSTIFGTKPT